MVRIVLFLSCLLLSCSMDRTYKVFTDWNITVVNKRAYNIDILIQNDSTDDEWIKPDRYDNYSQRHVNIAQDSMFSFTLKLSNYFFCENPYVESPTQYLYHIRVDSAHWRIDNISINLFPFPEFANYKLCSFFVAGDSAMYECNNKYFDTVTIFTDSVYSTSNYFYWSRYRIK